MCDSAYLVNREVFPTKEGDRMSCDIDGVTTYVGKHKAGEYKFEACHDHDGFLVKATMEWVGPQAHKK